MHWQSNRRSYSSECQKLWTIPLAFFGNVIFLLLFFFSLCIVVPSFRTIYKINIFCSFFHSFATKNKSNYVAKRIWTEPYFHDNGFCWWNKNPSAHSNDAMKPTMTEVPFFLPHHSLNQFFRNIQTHSLYHSLSYLFSCHPIHCDT